jgi:hypothetical protein
VTFISSVRSKKGLLKEEGRDASSIQIATLEIASTGNEEER